MDIPETLPILGTEGTERRQTKQEHNTERRQTKQEHNTERRQTKQEHNTERRHTKQEHNTERHSYQLLSILIEDFLQITRLYSGRFKQL